MGSSADRVVSRARIHLVNPLEQFHGGSEQRTLALFERLKAHANVSLWSNGKTDPLILEAYPVRHLDDDSPVPDGGTVVFVGWYKAPGAWLSKIRADRAVLIFNTPGFDALRAALKSLRLFGIEPELVFPSRWMRDASGLTGRVENSPINLSRFIPSGLSGSDRFRVGRLSRDVSGKHHGPDVHLYRALAQRGLQVRLMGATVLEPLFRAGGLPSGVELLPTGAQPAEEFLQSLDCFYYRTNDRWREPSGRVIVEAMACGLPVVAHRLGGYCEVIDSGVDGFLFDTPEQALKIIMVLARDAALRTDIGLAARTKVESLYGPDVEAQLLDFYLKGPG